MSEPNRPSRAAVGVLLLLALFALASAPAAAQPLYGSVVGNVKDAQGGIVPGGTVTLVNTGTNLKRETTTDAQGAFNFVNVLAGKYDVRVALPGFREAVRSGVPVSNGEISRVDIALEIGAMSETVTVKSEAELLQTDKADVKTDLKSDEIVNLPLNQFRNYQALVVLVPGALPPVFQNAETDTPQRSLAMTVNGQSGNANPTRTDGAMNVFVTMPHHTAYVAPAETIETVSITTGSMDAETGMAAGAAITVTTKSGTNTFKGSAFEFFANEKLAAQPYYFGRGATPTKLPVERQTAGGTLGGPILRNKLFFFSSYEGYFSDLNQHVFYSVPTAAMRNGDLSGALNTNGTLQGIYDPDDRRPRHGNRPAAVSEQRHPCRPDQPDFEDAGGDVPAAERRGHRRGRPDEQLPGPAAVPDGPAQRRLQGQLEPHVGTPDLGEVQPDESAGGRPVHVPDRRVGRRRRAHHRSSVHGRAHMVPQPDAAPRQLVRRLHAGSVRELTGLPPGQHRPRPGGSRHERPGARRSALRRHAAVLDRLHGARQHAGLEPHLPGRVQRFLQHQPHEGGRPARPQGRVFPEPPDAGRLAALHGQPARRVHICHGNATRTFGTGSQTGNFYNQYAAFLLGLVGDGRQGLPIPAVHRQRVPARAVLPRSVDADVEAHAGSGPALGVLPDHAAEGLPDRDARLEHARHADRRHRGQPEEHGSRRAEGLVCAAGRPRLPAGREDGASDRLRPDLRRAGHVG